VRAAAPRREPAWPDPRAYPQLRFMGSKHRLLPWLDGVLGELEFSSALDAFSGSGCVAYLLKTMGKEVRANDFLAFACDLTRATVANSHATLCDDDLAAVREPAPGGARFIEETFRGIFFGDEDNRFLDRTVHHAAALDPARRALVLASLHRACLKRQPRGVFTVSGLGRYDDGRRDLRLSLEEHFLESAAVFNALVFDSGREHRVTCGDVFALDGPDLDVDLVYLDPPYVPRADDNCYIKRYHFLEGLSTYWRDAEFHPTSRVRKLAKRHTPFSYRREADHAFRRLFERFAGSTIVLSYSSNGYPDLDVLVRLLREHKADVTVHEQAHRYHFGTHHGVAPQRTAVREYLLVGA
jgi:DNA adenine methylase/adenine-specific DNA-methyltransferase